MRFGVDVAYPVVCGRPVAKPVSSRRDDKICERGMAVPGHRLCNLVSPFRDVTS